MDNFVRKLAKGAALYILLVGLGVTADISGRTKPRKCSKRERHTIKQVTLSQQEMREAATKIVMPPVPPNQSRRFQGIYAIAMIEYDERGNVTRVEVRSTNQDRLVEQVVAQAARQWKFKPADDPCQRLRAQGTVIFGKLEPSRTIY